MVLRDATLNDVDRLAAMHIAAWQSAYRGLVPDDVLDNLSLQERREMWRGAIPSPTNSTTLAVDGDEILGFISSGPARDDDVDATTVAEILACYVHPSHWRRGIGETLWNHARDRLRGSYDQVTLWTWRD